MSLTTRSGRDIAAQPLHRDLSPTFGSGKMAMGKVLPSQPRRRKPHSLSSPLSPFHDEAHEQIKGAAHVRFITKSLLRSLSQQEDLSVVTSLTIPSDRSQSAHTIEGLDHTPNLTSLAIHHHMITKMERLGHLVRLQSLDLSFNRINAIEGIFSLTSLQNLRLSGNLISAIPNAMTALQGLRSLYLDQNDISSLSSFAALASLASLASFDFRDNPVASLPHSRAYSVHLLPALTVINTESVMADERKLAGERFSRSFEDEARTQLASCKERLQAATQQLQVSQTEVERVSALCKEEQQHSERLRREKLELEASMEELQGLLDTKSKELLKTQAMLSASEQELAFWKIDHGDCVENCSAPAAQSATEKTVDREKHASKDNTSKLAKQRELKRVKTGVKIVEAAREAHALALGLRAKVRRFRSDQDKLENARQIAVEQLHRVRNSLVQLEREFSSKEGEKEKEYAQWGAMGAASADDQRAGGQIEREMYGKIGDLSRVSVSSSAWPSANISAAPILLHNSSSPPTTLGSPVLPLAAGFPSPPTRRASLQLRGGFATSDEEELVGNNCRDVIALPLTSNLFKERAAAESSPRQLSSDPQFQEMQRAMQQLESHKRTLEEQVERLETEAVVCSATLHALTGRLKMLESAAGEELVENSFEPKVCSEEGLAFLHTGNEDERHEEKQHEGMDAEEIGSDTQLLALDNSSIAPDSLGNSTIGQSMAEEEDSLLNSSMLVKLARPKSKKIKEGNERRKETEEEQERVTRHVAELLQHELRGAVLEGMLRAQEVREQRLRVELEQARNAMDESHQRRKEKAEEKSVKEESRDARAELSLEYVVESGDESRGGGYGHDCRTQIYNSSSQAPSVEDLSASYFDFPRVNSDDEEKAQDLRGREEGVGRERRREPNELTEVLEKNALLEARVQQLQKREAELELLLTHAESATRKDPYPTLQRAVRVPIGGGGSGGSEVERALAAKLQQMTTEVEQLRIKLEEAHINLHETQGAPQTPKLHVRTREIEVQLANNEANLSRGREELRRTEVVLKALQGQQEAAEAALKKTLDAEEEAKKRIWKASKLADEMNTNARVRRRELDDEQALLHEVEAKMRVRALAIEKEELQMNARRTSLEVAWLTIREEEQVAAKHKQEWQAVSELRKEVRELEEMRLALQTQRERLHKAVSVLEANDNGDPKEGANGEENKNTGSRTSEAERQRDKERAAQSMATKDRESLVKRVGELEREVRWEKTQGLRWMEEVQELRELMERKQLELERQFNESLVDLQSQALNNTVFSSSFFLKPAESSSIKLRSLPDATEEILEPEIEKHSPDNVGFNINEKEGQANEGEGARNQAPMAAVLQPEKTATESCVRSDSGISSSSGQARLDQLQAMLHSALSSLFLRSESVEGQRVSQSLSCEMTELMSTLSKLLAGMRTANVLASAATSGVSLPVAKKPNDPNIPNNPDSGNTMHDNDGSSSIQCVFTPNGTRTPIARDISFDDSELVRLKRSLAEREIQARELTSLLSKSRQASLASLPLPSPRFTSSHSSSSSSSPIATSRSASSSRSSHSPHSLLIKQKKASTSSAVTPTRFSLERSMNFRRKLSSNVSPHIKSSLPIRSSQGKN